MDENENGDVSDSSFSSYESYNNLPVKTKYKSCRMSPSSSNSHPSRSESSTSSSPSPGCSPTPSSPGRWSPAADGESLERLIGIKQKYPCQVCGKKLINMESHMKKIHGEGKPGEVVSCGQCDQVILRYDLGKHVLEKHMEEAVVDRSISPPPVSEQDSDDVTNDMFADRCDDEERVIPPVILNQVKVEPSLSILLRSDVTVDVNQNSYQVPKEEEEHVDAKLKVVTYGSTIPNEKIYFWIKNLSRDNAGVKLRTVKMMMASDKTIKRVKRSYKDKLGLNMNNLHFIVDGRKLEDRELVGQLHTKNIYAEVL